MSRLIKLITCLLLLSTFCAINLTPAMAEGQPDLEPSQIIVTAYTGIINTIENDNAKNQTFNLTFGKSRSTKELAEIIHEYFPDIIINYMPKDKLTPDRGTLCIDKARKLLGYSPGFPLEKGIKEYIDWYQKPL